MNTAVGFYRDGDTIKTMVNSNKYKEALKYLSKLYTEGLVYPASFSQNSDQLTQLVEGPEQPIVGVVAGGYGGMFSIVGGERYRNYKAMSPLKGPEGAQFSRYFLQAPVIGNVAISKIARTRQLSPA